METTQSLTNHFVIAMPGLMDPYFTHSVTYICEHDENGAMGITINQPCDLNLSDLLTSMDIAYKPGQFDHQSILVGGPIQQERGFVLHETKGSWQASVNLSMGLAITSSRDILEAIGQNQGPENVLISLGYAGWGPGQLEKEIAENCWLTGPCEDTDIIFNLPYTERWHSAAKQLGIPLDRLISYAGHA